MVMTRYKDFTMTTIPAVLSDSGTTLWICLFVALTILVGYMLISGVGNER